MFFLLFFAYLIQHFYLVRLLFCFLSSNFTKLAQKLEKQKKMKFKAKNSLYWSIIGNAILVDFAKFMIRIEKGREKFKMTFIFIFLISSQTQSKLLFILIIKIKDQIQRLNILLARRSINQKKLLFHFKLRHLSSLDTSKRHIVL